MVCRYVLAETVHGTTDGKDLASPNLMQRAILDRMLQKLPSGNEPFSKTAFLEYCCFILKPTKHLLFLLIFFLSSIQAQAQGTQAVIDEPIQPIPNSVPLATPIAKLGEQLFFDKRLSKNENLSCASCHKLQHGGADPVNRSTKASGEKTQFNTPSIFNVAFNSAYYWSAKFNSLEMQIEESVANLDSDWGLILRRLDAIPDYQQQFAQLFSDGISKRNIQLSLISFEKTLATPDSRFDLYLKGDTKQLSQSEQSGYRLFKSYGCVACHQGINLGGNMYVQIRDKHAKPSYPQVNTTTITTTSATTTTITSKKSRMTKIRVPSLRNVALTAPYFHDGSVTSLRRAIRMEGKVNSRENLTQNEIRLLESFLKSLTGTYQGQRL